MREPDWSWTTPAGRVRAQRRAEMIMGWFFPVFNPGATVLEVGCGVGTFTEMFYDPRMNLTAIDIHPWHLSKVIRRFPQVQFELCRIEGFFPKSVVGEELKYHAIVGSSVLHHTVLIMALNRMYGLLKPGGRLSFAEPNLLNPQIWLERKYRRLFWYVSPSETAFTKWWIRDRLTEAGFVDVKVTPFDFLHPLTPRLLVPLVDRIGRLLEKIPVIKEFAGSLYIRARKPVK